MHVRSRVLTVLAPVRNRLYSWRWLAVILLALSLGTGEASAGPVQVEESPNTITLKNGIVTAVIDKSRAEVASITLEGARNLLSPKGVTFDAEAFGVGKNEAGIHGGNYKIVSNGPDQAEVSFLDPNFIFMTAEMHIIMRKDDPGVYEYLVMKHGQGQPAGGVGQLRWVFRGKPGILTHAFASATKQGQMFPEVPGAQTIADATFRLPKDSAYHDPMGFTSNGFPVYSKYDWSDYAENHVVHGFSSDQEGIWMVQPSMEYYNGGPSKGVLTVHNGPVSILEFLGGHFLIREHTGIELAENEEWQQTIGPWFVYLNKGANAGELWRDAYRRGLQEKQAWPYVWVQESADLYPRQRGTVAGELILPSGNAANALVVLGKPDKDWQTQSMDYLFWTRADAAGRFVIPKVRPGSYALYASVPGVVGELKITDVKVAASQTNDLGGIRWNPPRRAQLLWRVGTPDRSTAEFRFGNLPRQFGLWWRYLQEMGNQGIDLHGRSKPASEGLVLRAVRCGDGERVLLQPEVEHPVRPAAGGARDDAADGRSGRGGRWRQQAGHQRQRQGDQYHRLPERLWSVPLGGAVSRFPAQRRRVRFQCPARRAKHVVLPVAFQGELASGRRTSRYHDGRGQAGNPRQRGDV